MRYLNSSAERNAVAGVVSVCGCDAVALVGIACGVRQRQRLCVCVCGECAKGVHRPGCLHSAFARQCHNNETCIMNARCSGNCIKNSSNPDAQREANMMSSVAIDLMHFRQ